MFACAYVEFPAVAWAHDDIACEDAALELAACVRAKVGYRIDLSADSGE